VSSSRENVLHAAGADSSVPCAVAIGRGNTAIFMPVDARFPRVRIETKQRDSLADKRIVVTIDTWPPTSLYPLGHYTRTLGVIGDKLTETNVRRCCHGCCVGIGCPSR
jgi:exosome complex exonuclease DIS3/RRP44